MIQAWQSRLSGTVTTPEGHGLSFETGLLRAYSWRGLALDPVAAILPDAKDPAFAGLVDGYLARLGDTPLRVAPGVPTRSVRAVLEPAELAVWRCLEASPQPISALTRDHDEPTVRALVFALALAGRLERCPRRSAVTPRLTFASPAERAQQIYLAAEARGAPAPLGGGLGHYDAEIDALSRIVGEAPFEAAPYVYRARLFKRLGRLLEARRDYEKAARLDPDNAEAARELAEWEKRKSGAMGAVRPLWKPGRAGGGLG